ncbi:hypothetical protein C8R42DRAFT_112379 [Lentinula raphanica]|nr:hypothetical protein C8R42DRAFT_112379 [Lentinula raphanica]
MQHVPSFARVLNAASCRSRCQVAAVFRNSFPRSLHRLLATATVSSGFLLPSFKPVTVTINNISHSEWLIQVFMPTRSEGTSRNTTATASIQTNLLSSTAGISTDDPGRLLRGRPFSLVTSLSK